MDISPTRSLDPAAADKPLDVGNGRIAASIGLTGQIQAVSAFHAEHGTMVLSSDATFDDDHRFDVAAVRCHRSRLADPTGPGITVSTSPDWTPVGVFLDADVVPRIELVSGPVRATVTTWAPLGPAAAGLVQTWELDTTSAAPARLACRLAGLGRLARASLTQITEGGVLPTPDPATTTSFQGGTVVLEAPGLPAVAALDARVVTGRSGAVVVPALPDLDVTVVPGGGVVLVLRLGLGESRGEAVRELTGMATESLAPTLASWSRGRAATLARLPAAGDRAVQRLATRAISYAVASCTVPVGGTTCVVTDHRILPLAWTRDAYWTCTAVAEADPHGAPELVRGHLAWLFDVAERPDGWWARSYLPTGAVKDPAHQLDQQCYPLLEAVDHARRCGDVATLRRHAPTIREVLGRLLARRDPSGLLPTDETPADDPLELPFHLSSNLLVVHTLRAVAAVADVVDVDHATLVAAARRTEEAINLHLTIEVDGRRCLAYATDLSSSMQYHDANDVPTVLVPRWGLDVPHPVWRHTMETALSSANAAAFARGPHGGLGSVHTPGAWPLGDAQELMFAAWTGDAVRSATVLERLAVTASWDASLPESRDPDSGAVVSRHWFAWPGCLVVLALQMLGDRDAGAW